MGFATMSKRRVMEIARLGGTAVSHCKLCEAGFPLEDGYHIPTQRLGMIPVIRCRKVYMAGIGAKGGKARKGWRKARAQFRKEHPLP